jgi:DNA polymerase I-like protein with 3'-5' exonuclease and polymerase domains
VAEAVINSVLIDARTSPDVLERVKTELASCEVFGLDCETQDEARHEGLNLYNNKKRHVFDHRRTTMTGFSTYVEGSDTAYYFNLAQADEENRLAPSIVHEVLDAANPEAICVAHNAPFEIVMFRQCHNRDLNNMVCTLQMAVSHHGPDEYDETAFYQTPLPASFNKFVKEIILAWGDFDKGDRPNNEQQELLSKFIAKESKADHSYNGFVKSIAYGYNLKRLTESAFGYKQKSYDAVLAENNATHMGELTGEQVVAYGADDAYWAVKHFRRLLDDMLTNNPKALKAFLETENKMVQLYADSWQDGIRLNLPQVFARQGIERQHMAEALRTYKAQIKALLPFPAEPHPKLLEREKWYAKNWQSYRAKIEAWANSADVEDDFEQVYQISNAVGNAWAAEKGKSKPTGKLSLNHYMPMRVIMYDLLRVPMQYDQGSVASDKEARGKIRLKLEDAAKDAVMASMQTLSEIEQKMKLYLTPYTQLMDPETSRVYPSLSSQLATRRLATSFPNPMQLAKLGESAYIRGFYLADTDDDVVVSADWAAIELVLIGDQSRDEGFREVYGQLPYGDMHSGAAVDGLGVKTLPGLTEEEFKEFKFGRNPNKRKLVDHSGRELAPSDFHKWARGTAVGKGINFSYWYSGALSTVAENLGWTDKEHWEAVDRYRARFPQAEEWRVGQQQQASAYGFVELPDGHRRTRFEATMPWAKAMEQKFANITAHPALLAYGNTAIRRIQSRARNQVVNALIQGTCATLAKRSLLTLQEACAAVGLEWRKDWRLMMPIHDELVFSVKRRHVMQFISLLRQAMTTHPAIVQTLPLHCTVAIGRTFRPFSKTEPKLTQIELDEASVIDGVIGQEYEGKALNDNQVEQVLEWMFA